MGTRMAPSYANLFVGSLEEDFLNSEDSRPDFWLRSIDDLFLWTHSHDYFLFFLECLNNQKPGQSPPPMLPFLLLTSKTSALMSTSSHHQQYSHHLSTKSSISFSQAIHGRRIYSIPVTFPISLLISPLPLHPWLPCSSSRMPDSLHPTTHSYPEETPFVS